MYQTKIQKSMVVSRGRALAKMNGSKRGYNGRAIHDCAQPSTPAQATARTNGFDKWDDIPLERELSASEGIADVRQRLGMDRLYRE